MSVAIPRAKNLFRGDINAAVIAVQKAVGVEINEVWWATHVGNDGSTEEILERFDKNYPALVASKLPPEKDN